MCYFVLRTAKRANRILPYLTQLKPENNAPHRIEGSAWLALRKSSAPVASSQLSAFSSQLASMWHPSFPPEDRTSRIHEDEVQMTGYVLDEVLESSRNATYRKTAFRSEVYWVCMGWSSWNYEKCYLKASSKASHIQTESARKNSPMTRPMMRPVNMINQSHWCPESTWNNDNNNDNDHHRWFHLALKRNEFIVPQTDIFLSIQQFHYERQFSSFTTGDFTFSNGSFPWTVPSILTHT